MSSENPVVTRQFRSPRATEVASFVRSEIEQYRIGQIQTLKSNEEVAQMFGYPYKTSVGRIVRWAGLLEERAQINQEIESRVLTPSKDLAWMIGCLAGGGNTGERSRRIAVYGPEALLKAAKSTGEDLFRVNGKETGKAVEFNLSKLPGLFGDLRRSTWGSTIRERHHWVLENPEYTWRLLEGLFDTIGLITLSQQDRSRTMIGFNTSYLANANLLADALVLVGVKTPVIDKDQTGPEGIKRVAVYNITDAKLLAENIHSHIEEKEGQLQRLRELSTDRKLPVKVLSEEDLITEWNKLRQLLNHPPTVTDIKRLRTEGQTIYGPDSYTERFGRLEGERSFKLARENIEQVVFTREVNAVLSRYSKEIKYTPKVHRDPELEAKQKLEQILEELKSITQQSDNKSILVDPSGKPF